MRPDEFAVAITQRRLDLQAQVFNTPPQDYQEFVKRLGVWTGLGEALSIVADAEKKERTDE